MRVITHLISTAAGALFRALGMAILLAAAGGGLTLFVIHQVSPEWPPSMLSEITAGVIGVLSGYAGATTIVLRAIAKGIVGAAETVEKEVTAPATS